MDFVYIGLFFSTLMSWAVMADINTLDFELPTTWILLAFCIPGYLITVIITIPIALVHGIGYGINKLWFRLVKKNEKTKTV